MSDQAIIEIVRAVLAAVVIVVFLYFAWRDS